VRTVGGLGFPESLRWHEGDLWWSDMFRGRVQRLRDDGRLEDVLVAADGGPEVPGGLGWLPDGTLLVVDVLQRRVLAVRGGAVAVHADLRPWMSHPANDMWVDPDGTAWVGGYGFDPESQPVRGSRLVRVGAEGGADPWGADLVFPNGCERGPGGELVVAETFADRVSALDASGRRTTTVELAPGSGPDGLSIGPDGTLYVALAFASQVWRVAPRGGPILHAAPIAEGPGRGPLGCYDCAVSPDGTTIAVATASLDEELAQRVDTGSVTLHPLPPPG
jgi:sugar lactone lactonase YvrE